MQIHEEDLYHGAALNQIAEHELFTAINALKVDGNKSRSAFRINDEIVAYFKYCSKPAGRFSEYKFTFHKSHIKDIRNIASLGDKLHLALICVKDRQICCISSTLFFDMIEERRKDAKRKEDQYQLLVTLKEREAFRVYMNKYGRKGTFLSDPVKVPRNRFPNALFE